MLKFNKVSLNDFSDAKKSVLARIISSDEMEISIRSLSEKERLQLPWLFDRGYIVFTEIKKGSIPFSFKYNGVVYSIMIGVDSKITITEIGELQLL